jgi:hypothetical protein
VGARLSLSGISLEERDRTLGVVERAIGVDALERARQRDEHATERRIIAVKVRLVDQHRALEQRDRFTDDC